MHSVFQDVFVSWPRTPRHASAGHRRLLASRPRPGGDRGSFEGIHCPRWFAVRRFQPFVPDSHGASRATREGTSREHKCRCNRQSDINVMPHRRGGARRESISTAKCCVVAGGTNARVGARFALACASLRHGTRADVRQRVGIFATGHPLTEIGTVAASVAPTGGLVDDDLSSRSS